MGRQGVVLAACTALLLAGCSEADSSSAPTGTPTQTVSESPSPAAEPLSWDRLAAQSSASVVMIQTSSCDASPGTGSGFVVGPDLVMTAAHVIDTASAAAVRLEGGRIVPADLVAYDSTSDSALLRTAEPLDAEELTLVRSDPKQGQELAVLGYPLGEPRVTMSSGVVSALGQTLVTQTSTVDGVFLTDAAVNSGNSGGPAMDRYGEVIGLVSAVATRDPDYAGPPIQGIAYVIPSPFLVEDLEGWRDRQAMGFPDCEEDATRPDEDEWSTSLDVIVAADHEDAYTIAATLAVHGQSINEGNYSSAWEMFTEANKARAKDLAAWSRGLETSYWRSLTIESVERHGDSATAAVVLRTEQSAADGFAGQTCSIHSMNYEFALVDGVWLIDLARRPADPEAC